MVWHFDRIDIGEAQRTESLTLGVGREQQLECSGTDNGHDRARIRVLGLGTGRARPRREQLDRQVACPEAHGRKRGDALDVAALRCSDRGAEAGVGVAVTTIEQQLDRKALDHLGETAVVVARGVGRDDDRESLDAGCAEQAGSSGLGWAGVEQDGRSAAVLDQGRVALADVEEGDGETLRWRRDGDKPRHSERPHSRERRQCQPAPAQRQPPPRCPRGGRLRLQATGEATACDRHQSGRRVGADDRHTRDLRHRQGCRGELRRSAGHGGEVAEQRADNRAQRVT